jgi:hypothetical protein
MYKFIQVTSRKKKLKMNILNLYLQAIFWLLLNFIFILLLAIKKFFGFIFSVFLRFLTLNKIKSIHQLFIFIKPYLKKSISNQLNILDLISLEVQALRCLHLPSRLKIQIKKIKDKDKDKDRLALNSISVTNPYLFLHSGHLGDIIYSLLSVKTLFASHGKSVDFYIEKNVKNEEFMKGHPTGGDFMISIKSYKFIEPLLLKQSYINSVKFVTRAEITDKFTDLSIIRNKHINTAAGSSTDWYSKALGISCDLAIKWISSPKSQSKYKNALIVSRSLRYQNTSIDYRFLNKIKNVYFIGLPEEYKSFISEFKLAHIEYIYLKDALHAADIINSCKCFIGNQSFFFSIAEGLKVARALEVFEPAPNVIPLGRNTLSYLFTQQLISFLKLYFNFAEDKLNIKQPNNIVSRAKL